MYKALICLASAATALAALRGGNVTSESGVEPLWYPPDVVPLRRLTGSGNHEIQGVATSLMEDHFDVGAHFMTTVVETDTGDVVMVDTPHGEQYSGTPVRWIVQDKTEDDINRDHKQFQQRFSSRWSQAYLNGKYKKARGGSGGGNGNGRNGRDLSGGLRRLGVVNFHGSNSIIVIRVGVVDGSNNVVMPTYCDETCVWNNMFDNAQNVAGQFLDTSDGFTFSRAASAVITVQTSISTTASSNCDFDGYADAAIAAAQAMGYQPDNYSFRLFLIPQQLPCNWGGLAYVGCSSPRYCRAWTRYADPSIMAHELGHSCGMNHASLDNNNDGTLDVEYGDISDPLGSNSAYKRFNAVHRLEMGWLNPAAVLTNPSGTRTLTSSSIISGTSTTPALYKLTSSATVDDFYVSLRTATGAYDSSLPTGFKNVVFIHRWPGYGNTMLVSRLAAGATFTDANNGITVSVNSIDLANNVASVYIGGCTYAAPTVVFTSSPIAINDCSTPSSYPIAFTVTNANTGCASVPITSYFSSLPPGWSIGNFAACNTVTVTITPDNFPSETSWTLRDINGVVLASGASAAGGSLSVCNTAGPLLNFTILDTYGDGICCGFGSGSYAVSFNGVTVASGGAFARSESTVFANGASFSSTLITGASASYTATLNVPGGVVGGSYTLGLTSTSFTVPSLPSTTTPTTVDAWCGIPASVTSSVSVSPPPSSTPSLSQPPSITSTPSRTPTNSASLSSTRTPTRSPSLTASTSLSRSISLSSSNTRTSSLTPSPTRSLTSVASQSKSPSLTKSPSLSRSSTKSRSLSKSTSLSRTPTRTRTPASASRTPTPTKSP